MVHFVCSYLTLSFRWLAFLNFLKILGGCHTSTWWTVLNSKGSWHMFCLLSFMTVSPKASHVSEKADWRFPVGRGSQGNVLTVIFFQVPMRKKQVTEQEPPTGLLYLLLKENAFLPVILNLYMYIYFTSVGQTRISLRSVWLLY